MIEPGMLAAMQLSPDAKTATMSGLKSDDFATSYMPLPYLDQGQTTHCVMACKWHVESNTTVTTSTAAAGASVWPTDGVIFSGMMGWLEPTSTHTPMPRGDGKTYLIVAIYDAFDTGDVQGSSKQHEHVVPSLGNFTKSLITKMAGRMEGAPVGLRNEIVEPLRVALHASRRGDWQATYDAITDVLEDRFRNSEWAEANEVLKTLSSPAYPVRALVGALRYSSKARSFLPHWRAALKLAEDRLVIAGADTKKILRGLR